MMEDAPADYILQLVANVASLTEKITALQDSVNDMAEKLTSINKLELDFATMKKELALTENKAQKSHDRIDTLSVRVELLEDKTATRIKKISEKAFMWILGALGMLIVANIKDIIEMLWSTK